MPVRQRASLLNLKPHPVLSSVPTDSAVLPAATPDPDAPSSTNFIEAIIEEDLRTGATDGRVATRFPPEPNGYLHIGHAKSICLNFGLARAYGGQCHLRFDDTNPTTESLEFVESIKQDVHWLGFDWDTHLYFASDYFEPLYAYAVQLIKDGKAYVDSLNEEAIRDYRGSVTEPGRESPYRIRSVEENLDLFERMRAGEFEDGTHVLRARIDMASPNMLLRDPLLYRIRHAHHYRTGDGWCIYPMYDYAHPLSDAIEGITHSICTLEFEVHRPLYDWVVENTRKPPRPHQYEFARLNLDYTVMSKRKLLQLVNDGHVDGWDDPRMPTLAGLRRRGVTPDAIRAFCDRIGVAKADNRIDIGLLEYCIRDDLNWKAPRVMCVLRPLKVVLTNYPEDRTESMEAPSYPPDVDKDGSRIVPFSRELYIEREDFEEHPPKGFFRLAPGREVRLRYGYIIKCEEVVKDETGEVVELRCTYDPATRSGSDTSGRKVKGTIHWVSATHSLPAEVRLYDRLFRVPNPDVEPGDFIDYLNSNSIEILRTSRVEPSVADDPTGTRYQFTRQGYFTSDRIDSSPDVLVFNRIVTLRDSWAKKTEATKTENTRKASPAPPAPKPKPSSAAEANGSSHEAPELRLDEKNPGLLARFEEYTETLGVPPLQADLLTSDPAIAGFFEDALAVHRNPTALANWVVNEVLRELKDRTLDELPFTGADLGALVALIDDETISTRLAKTVFEDMLETGDAPNAIVERKGLTQVTDPDALAPIVDRLIAEHPDKVEAYRSGKTGLMGFFVGQVMRSTRGKANPQLVQDLVQRALE